MPEASVTTSSRRIEAAFDANLDFPFDNASVGRVFHSGPLHDHQLHRP